MTATDIDAEEKIILKLLLKNNIFTCKSRGIRFFRFFNIFSVQNYNPVPPPTPPPPPPTRLFKPRENQLEKELDQQAKGDIPPIEQGGNPFIKKAKGRD